MSTVEFLIFLGVGILCLMLGLLFVFWLLDVFSFSTTGRETNVVTAMKKNTSMKKKQMKRKFTYGGW